MPTNYRKADDEIVGLMLRVMRAYLPDLHEAGVHVGVVEASNPEGDAVKHGGHPAFATVKVVSSRDRVSKGFDVELLIDRDKWDELRDAQRVALLHHELKHVRLKKSWRTAELDPVTKEPTGASVLHFERDDKDRPKLKTVPGDWNCGDGFREVVAVHGENAIEYENIARCRAMADRARTEGADLDADRHPGH